MTSGRAFLLVLVVWGLVFAAALIWGPSAHGCTLSGAGAAGGREVKKIRAALVLAICVGCAGGVDGNGLLPPGRTPVPVGGDAAAALEAAAPPVDGLPGIEVGAAPDVGGIEAPPPAPDARPEIEAPPPALPACPPDQILTSARCPSSTPGSCRTSEGAVCYECPGVAAACQWMGAITQPMGPRCAEPRICVPPGSSCPVTNGPVCTRGTP